MKHLFLDIDGVLNCRKTFQELDCDPWWAAIDPTFVRRLNHIVDQTGCIVVLSSSWRQMLRGRKRTQEILEQHGATFVIADETPMLTEDRGDEILAWMKANGVDKDDVVILDDDSDMGDLADRLVQTSMHTGLTAKLAEEAISLLKA